MFKKLSKNIGEMVKNESKIIGTASNQVLQSFGLESTGNFVEEQIIDNGENSSSNINLMGQSVEGAAKTAGGYITKDEELIQSGFEDLNEAKNTYIDIQVTNITEKVVNVSKIGTGIRSGNMRQVNDGATGLIGLKKSAVGLNILDDLTEFKKV